MNATMNTQTTIELKKVDFLLYHSGENRGNYSIIREYTTIDKELLNNTCMRCVNSGMDMLVEVKEYIKETIEIPIFMSPEFYIEHNISLKYMFRSGFKLEWGEQWLNKMLNIDSYQRYVYIQLLCSNPRTNFRKSLKENIINWLNSDTNKYDNPLSPKQFDCLHNKYIKKDYNYLSERLYHSRSEIINFI